MDVTFGYQIKECAELKEGRKKGKETDIYEDPLGERDY